MREIIGYLREATEIAAARQHSAGTRRKEDNTYVTDTDMELSHRAIERFSAVVGEANIVTEEHPEALVRSHDVKYLLVVDPIDGTRNYVHGLPFYAISVGVLKEGKPWIGGVAFPGLREMVWCDGTVVEWERGEGAPAEHRRREEKDLYFINEDFFRRYRWDYNAGSYITLGCSVMELCMPVLGRGAGTLFTGKVWDMAGVWPMIRLSGRIIRGLESGEELTRYEPEWFRVTVSDLSRSYNVSEETIRRDLSDLEEQGVLVRTHGGAYIQESMHPEIPFWLRRQAHRESKSLIADAAARMVENGDTLFFDTSTTVLELVNRLGDKRNLVVITNALHVAASFAEMQNAKVICVGGTLHQPSLSTVGRLAQDVMRRFYADKAFFSCGGLDRERGITDANEEESEIRKAMIQQSRERILVADHTKFDTTSFTFTGDFRDIEVVVTDRQPPEEWLRLLAETETR
ncbi:MAG: DeoR family transcriptional regulator, partial [Spirochaetaceae bacterium]